MVSRFLIAAIVLAPTPALAVDALDAAAGRALFARNWVSSPSSIRTAEGLGPLYDARSCSACHDATRATPQNSIGAGLIVRLGRGDGSADAIYGTQLQTHAVQGVAPEADARMHWHDDAGLRVAVLELTSFSYGPLSSNTHAALRRAPDLAGVGTLAAIADGEILSRANRRDADGVRGRPSWVTDTSGHCRLGRFGWKANAPDLTASTEIALQRDIGLSTTSRPAPWGECTTAEQACRGSAGPSGAIEVSDAARDAIVAYLASLPAPIASAKVSVGSGLFEQIGCSICHATLKAAGGTNIYAFSDLLLHDMGKGLDDGIAESDAKSFEWRTAPLWDVAASLKSGGLLHDGRARSIAEAVAWHGGEASRSRERFASLSAGARAAIEKFLLKQ